MFGISSMQRARQTTVLPSPHCQLRLRIRLPNGKKRIASVSAAKCTIGAHPDCQIRIPGKMETGVHCVLLRSRGRVVVRSWSDDCTINGRKFEIATLGAGDILRAGKTSIKILPDRKRKKQRKQTKTSPATLGKQLVREIGSRLAHLEQRLVKRQRSLTKQIEARTAFASKPLPQSEAAPTPTKPVEAAPSPIVLEGITTLRSAVEELRAQVVEVATRPWPSLEPNHSQKPQIDAEALIESASARVGDVIGASLREDRIASALKFEQIGREFDRIGERLGDVEQKLSLPTADLIEKQVRPVCEAVDFIRTGLKAIEDRQTLDATRFADFSSGLAALSQSTMERLGELTNKIGAMPNLSNLELSLANVSEKVEGLSQEIVQRQNLYVTRDDIAALVKQFEPSTAFQAQWEDRFVAIDQRFDGMMGEWSKLQAGTDEQLKAIAERIDALPATPAASASMAEQVDFSPLEQKLAECRLELADYAQAITGFSANQQDCAARVATAELTLQQVQTELNGLRSFGDRIDQLTTELTEGRDRAAESIEHSQSAQNSLLEKLLALEDRCVYLESELARLSHAAATTPNSFIAPQSASAIAIQCEPTESEATYPIEEAPFASRYAPEISETSAGNFSTETFDDSGEGSADDYPSAPPEAVLKSSPLSDSAQFAALKRAAVLSRSALEESSTRVETPSKSTAAQGSEEDAANVPNSIVESLRRSGIWKDPNDASGQNDGVKEAQEDPRDVVGSAFQADSAPPGGIGPGKHAADPMTKTPWGGPHPASDENEEESIDAYMERLMQRVTGGTGEVTGAMAVAEHLQRAKAQMPKKTKAPVEAEDGDFEYTPKVAAPEKSADLSALRELAMTSANVNIQNYHAAAKAKTANEKWIVVVVAMICAMGLCYICINYKSDWSYLAAGAAFMVALYWAIQASFSTAAAKRVTQNAREKAAGDEKTNSKVDVDLFRNVKKAKSQLDQPSAGETFLALVAERERERSSNEATEDSNAQAN